MRISVRIPVVFVVALMSAFVPACERDSRVTQPVQAAAAPAAAAPRASLPAPATTAAMDDSEVPAECAAPMTEKELCACLYNMIFHAGDGHSDGSFCRFEDRAGDYQRVVIRYATPVDSAYVELSFLGRRDGDRVQLEARMTMFPVPDFIVPSYQPMRIVAETVDGARVRRIEQAYAVEEDPARFSIVNRREETMWLWCVERGGEERCGLRLVVADEDSARVVEGKDSEAVLAEFRARYQTDPPMRVAGGAQVTVLRDGTVQVRPAPGTNRNSTEIGDHRLW